MLLLAIQLQAQAGERAQRVQSIKVGYITQKLHLTEDQAKNFWPIYNSYEDELRIARKAFMEKHPEARRADTTTKSTQFIEDHLALQQQVLDLRMKYKDRLLKVITADQLADLYEAERDFRALLVEQLRKQKEVR
jgi:hypothetical protein